MTLLWHFQPPSGPTDWIKPTNVPGKEWSNHEAIMDVFFAVYNFCKVHGTIKTTPAVAAGITDHVWTVRELIEKTSGAH